MSSSTTWSTPSPSASITATKSSRRRPSASRATATSISTEEESRGMLESVDQQLHRRRKGSAVRLEIEAGADQEIVDRLASNFRLAPWQVFRTDGPVNLSRLFHLYDQTPRPDLKYRTVRAARAGPEAGHVVDLRAPAQAQRPAAPSVRFLFHRGPLHRKRGAGSRTSSRSSRRSIAPAKIRRSSAR